MELIINLDGNENMVDDTKKIVCSKGIDAKIGVLKIAHDRVPEVVSNLQAAAEIKGVSGYTALIPSGDGKYLMLSDVSGALTIKDKLLITGSAFIARMKKNGELDNLTAAEIFEWATYLENVPVMTRVTPFGALKGYEFDFDRERKCIR